MRKERARRQPRRCRELEASPRPPGLSPRQIGYRFTAAAQAADSWLRAGSHTTPAIRAPHHRLESVGDHVMPAPEAPADTGPTTSSNRRSSRAALRSQVYWAASSNAWRAIASASPRSSNTRRSPPASASARRPRLRRRTREGGAARGDRRDDERRAAQPSVEEPDAAEPTRPALWRPGVSNDPGLPDRERPDGTQYALASITDSEMKTGLARRRYGRRRRCSPA